MLAFVVHWCRVGQGGRVGLGRVLGKGLRKQHVLGVTEQTLLPPSHHHLPLPLMVPPPVMVTLVSLNAPTRGPNLMLSALRSGRLAIGESDQTLQDVHRVISRKMEKALEQHEHIG